MLRSAAIVAAAILVPTLALAQKEPPSGLTKEQLAKIADLAAAVDRAVVKGFEGDKELRPLLESELKRIAAIKDPKAKRAELANFQIKYEKRYQAVLQRGGVDLVALAQKIGQIVPGVRFSLERGTHLVSLSSEPTAESPAPVPTTKSKDLVADDFSLSRSSTCQLFGGGEVTRRSLSILNSVTGIEAGGCVNEGKLYYQVQIPSGYRARVNVRGSATADVFALSLGGFSEAIGRAGVSVGTRSVGTYCWVVAPIAWGAGASCAEENFRLTVDFDTDRELHAYTFSTAGTVGIVAGTTATTTAKMTEATVTYEPVR